MTELKQLIPIAEQSYKFLGTRLQTFCYQTSEHTCFIMLFIILVTQSLFYSSVS